MKILHPTDSKKSSIKEALRHVPLPSTNEVAPETLLSRCPRAHATPLVGLQDLAAYAGVAEVWCKDERNRMDLGSFKALGAAYVIACDAQEGRAAGQTYVTASAGNHGLSVAAGAAAFGARSVVYLADTVPEAFASSLAEVGAEVVREGRDYEESMAAAAAASQSRNWCLLSDSSWDGYFDVPYRLMEGYLVLMKEVVELMERPPSHIFLQAGVGGLAATSAAYVRKVWGAGPRIIVVEPEAAPALYASVIEGRPVKAEGPVSCMGRLDCKDPSLIALNGLARDADDFVQITEEEGRLGAEVASQFGFPTTPSGAAGLAALLASEARAFGLNENSNVLIVLSEGPEA